MKKYLIDTDIIIDLLKNQFEIFKKIEAVGIGNCFVSEITIAELHFGAAKSKNSKHDDDTVKISSLFKVIPITDVLALYGQEKAKLVLSGNSIPDFDILIAVTSVQLGLVLVTGNEKHHKRIENIQVENWRKKVHNEFIV